jgi:hypothetical protein
MHLTIRLLTAAASLLVTTPPVPAGVPLHVTWDPGGTYADLPSWPHASPWALLYVRGQTRGPMTDRRIALVAYDAVGPGTDLRPRNRVRSSANGGSRPTTPGPGSGSMCQATMRIAPRSWSWRPSRRAPATGDYLLRLASPGISKTRRVPVAQ